MSDDRALHRLHLSTAHSLTGPRFRMTILLEIDKGLCGCDTVLLREKNKLIEVDLRASVAYSGSTVAS
jgi:hypothetical protein